MGLGCHYIISLPCALIFAFFCKWSVYGLWIGQSVGVVVEFFLYTRLIFVTSWERVAAESTERIQGERERLNPKQNIVNDDI